MPAGAAAAARPAVPEMAPGQRPRLHLSSLPPGWNNNSAQAFFSRIGNVVDCVVFKDPHTGHSKYGFLEFEDQACAIKAIEQYNEKEVEGSVLQIKFAKPKGGASIPLTGLKAEEQSRLFVANIGTGATASKQQHRSLSQHACNTADDHSTLRPFSPLVAVLSALCSQSRFALSSSASVLSWSAACGRTRRPILVRTVSAPCLRSCSSRMPRTRARLATRCICGPYCADRRSRWPPPKDRTSDPLPRSSWISLDRNREPREEDSTTTDEVAVAAAVAAVLTEADTVVTAAHSSSMEEEETIDMATAMAPPPRLVAAATMSMRAAAAAAAAVDTAMTTVAAAVTTTIVAPAAMITTAAAAAAVVAMIVARILIAAAALEAAATATTIAAAVDATSTSRAQHPPRRPDDPDPDRPTHPRPRRAPAAAPTTASVPDRARADDAKRRLLVAVPSPLRTLRWPCKA